MCCCRLCYCPLCCRDRLRGAGIECGHLTGVLGIGKQSVEVIVVEQEGFGIFSNLFGACVLLTHGLRETRIEVFERAVGDIDNGSVLGLFNLHEKTAHGLGMLFIGEM